MIAALPPVQCLAPVDAGDDASAQTAAYARRSIAIVALAAQNDRTALNKLVAPDAKFGLGAGDVGLPLQSGAIGALAMARELNATTYTYKGWDFIPMPQDPCGKQAVEVEFIPADGKSSAVVTFTYQAGLLTSAQGWWHSRVTGRVVEYRNG